MGAEREHAAAERGDGLGRVKGSQTLQKVATLGITRPVTGADLSADGKRLTYGRDDATVAMAYNTLIAAPTSATLFVCTGSIPSFGAAA